jgi:SAM-dependent methyltransferase
MRSSAIIAQMQNGNGSREDGRPGLSREQEHPSLRAALAGWWQDRRAREGFLPALLALSSELWNFLCDSAPARERQRYGDVGYDWDRRVNTTSAAVGWRNRLLGVLHSPYQPTEPVLFREMIDALGIDVSQYTFLDLGSGKGRTLLMAAEYPFRRVLGVELLPELNRIAQENIRGFTSERRHCEAVESLCGDARLFEFPLEPLVIYLFNPFLESGLAQVIRNLEQSLLVTPRPVIVLYHSPLLAKVLDASAALKKTRGTHQYAIYRNA